ALVAFALLVPPARLDPVAHARPFLEPGVVVAGAAFERAAHPVHLVDLDAGPGRGAETDQQPHRPAVVVGEVEEGGGVFAADHDLLLVLSCRSHESGDPVSTGPPAMHMVPIVSFGDYWIIRLRG